MTDRTVDPVTGEIHDPPATGCERCKAHHDRAEAIHRDLLAAEASLRRERSRAQALEGELRQRAEADPKSKEVRAVLEHWQRACGHERAAVPMTGARAKAVRSMLRIPKFDEAFLRRAVDGAALLPFVGPQGRQGDDSHGANRHDDITLICRDEQHVERFEGYVAAAQERKRAAVEVHELLGRLEAVRQAREGQWVARCPAHDDRHASLSVAEGEKGVVLHCHSGCQPDAITAALDVGLSALFSADAQGAGVPARTRTVQVAAPSAVPTAPLPSQADIDAFVKRLVTNERLLARLEELRGWTLPALVALEVGFDGERLTLPVRDAMGRLVNVMRYRPGGTKPKMLPWGPGHGRDLFPAPEAEVVAGDEVWIAEGEADAITGRELGLPVVAVPGANGWRDEWAPRFAGRRVVVVADCDGPGREAAGRVARSVVAHASEVRLVELDETQTDGFDLTDAALGGATAMVLRALAVEAPVVRREEEAA